MRAITVLLTAILCVASSARGADDEGKSTPPTHPHIGSQVTFLYHRDMAAGEHFYGTILGLKKTFDQGWVKMFQLTDQSFVGVVQEGRGYHPAPKSTPSVMVSIETKDLMGWYRQLKERKAKFLKDLDANNDDLPVQPILLEDPAGYTVEIYRWKAPES